MSVGAVNQGLARASYSSVGHCVDEMHGVLDGLHL